MTADLRVELAPRHPGGLRLGNPVLAAAGSFGWGTGYGAMVDPASLGAIVTNGTTLAPREAAPTPRVAEVPGGMLNALGWVNPGLEAVIAAQAAAWDAAPTHVIVNVVPTNASEAHALGSRLGHLPGVAALEVDITLALAHSSHPDYVARVVHTLRAACGVPVIVKLPATGVDVLEAAARMEQVGVDALTVINTLPAMAIDVRRRAPVLASVTGGLSGPAVKSVALYFTWQVSQRVTIPVIGVGGISSANDALEFLMAGAIAVQVGSASFRNPTAIPEIVSGLAAYLDREGLTAVGQLVGAARR